MESLPLQLRPTKIDSPLLQLPPTKHPLYLRPTKVDGMDIFVYSAIAVSVSSDQTDIRIQAIRHVGEKKILKCCFQDKHGADMTIDAKVKYVYHKFVYKSTTLNCVVNSRDVPKTISLSHNCSLKNRVVVEVSQPEKPKGSISVCFHALYGFPDPQLMTEWFEFIKLQDIGRVFIYPVNHKNFLDERAMRVLEYYRNQGLINLIPYELRQYSTNKKRFEKRNDEMYSDEILPVFDCMARSSLYKYTAYIDFDEVILFNSDPLDLVGNLDKMLENIPKAGIFAFKIESFVFNWTATHNSNLIMMKYVNRTEALNERKKMVYIQGRYRNIAPHDPFPSFGFKGVVVNESTAVIHHYRSCRDGWSDKYCWETPRYQDDVMLKFESILNEKVKQVPEHIRKGL